MANLPVEIDQPPSYLTKYAPEDLDNSEYDVPGGEPLAIVSIRGGKWKVRYKGEEGILRDPEGHARPYFDCVLVRASKVITKTYYINDYTPGSNAAPDCMSSNGVVPDASSPKKQHDNCKDCPHNQWNTAKVGGGKRCQDNERMAILPTADLLNENLGGAMLLRIPPGSFSNLRTYKKDCTDRNRKIGVGITRLSFDEEASYPEIRFEWRGYLDEDSADVVIECRNSTHVQRILNLTVQEVAQATGGATEAPEAAEAEAPEPLTVTATTARERVAAAQAAQGKPATKPKPTLNKPAMAAKPVVQAAKPVPVKAATVVPIKPVVVEETAVEKKRRELADRIEQMKRDAAELEEMEAAETSEGVGNPEYDLEASAEEGEAEEAVAEEETDPADDLLDDLDRQIGAIPG